jgi:hypothetical protein
MAGLLNPETEEDRIAQQRALVGYADDLSRQQARQEFMSALGNTWPAQMAKSAYQAVRAPGDVVQGRLDPRSDDAIKRAADLAGTLMMGGFPLGASVGREAAAQGGMALGIVPVQRAGQFGYPATAGSNEVLQRSIRQTPGASITEEGAFRLPVVRNQLEEQAGEASTRGGVFYLPEKSAYERYYKSGGTAGNYYGGSERITGETAFYNPIVVKGQTGGKAPEAAFSQIMGKDALAGMQRDISHYSSGVPKEIQVDAISAFLKQWAPELEPKSYEIWQNSRKGNQLRYALQEAAVGSAVRNAGYDGVIGYGVKRDKSPFVSEVFDVRENRYPTAQGGYSVWEDLGEKSARGLLEGVPKNAKATSPRKKERM